MRGWRGLREDLGRLALLGDHAMVHEHDPVGDLAGEVHLVGHDQHGHAARGEVAHHGQHLADQLRVERARDLVEQHRLGLHGERAGDRDALLLAAGELLGIVVAAVGEADLAQQRLGRARAPSRWAASARAAAPR